MFAVRLRAWAPRRSTSVYALAHTSNTTCSLLLPRVAANEVQPPPFGPDANSGTDVVPAGSSRTSGSIVTLPPRPSGVRWICVSVGHAELSSNRPTSVGALPADAPLG